MPRSGRSLGRNDLIASSYTLTGVPVFEPARFSFVERVEAAAKAGFNGIGVAIEDYVAMHERGTTDAELRRILDDNGIVAAELEFLTNWWWTDERQSKARKTEEQFYAAADAFGARHVNASSGGMRGTIPSFEQLVESFAALCDRAAGHDLKVAYEFLPWSDVPDAATAGKLIASAGRPNGGVLIDTWHYFRGAADPAQVKAIPPDRFFLIQFDDADAQMKGDWMEDTTDYRRYPGEGSFDLTGFIRMLDDHGVEAPFSVEILSKENRALSVLDAARRSHNTSRAIIARARSKR
ncbi:MAG TPA: sugar phosphate isomerase/epimerase family protein [Candidatus Binataceae bacterium]|nr:sugar phosphate isomerase/epimerase family protein [Candidatus Binataceae bacterium]